MFACDFVPPHAYGRIAIYQGFIAIASAAEYIERPVGDALLYIVYSKLPGVQDNPIFTRSNREKPAAFILQGFLEFVLLC